MGDKLETGELGRTPSRQEGIPERGSEAIDGAIEDEQSRSKAEKMP